MHEKVLVFQVFGKGRSIFLKINGFSRSKKLRGMHEKKVRVLLVFSKSLSFFEKSLVVQEKMR